MLENIFVFKNTVLFEQKRLRKISLIDFILRNNELRREPRMKGGGDGGKGRGYDRENRQR